MLKSLYTYHDIIASWPHCIATWCSDFPSETLKKSRLNIEKKKTFLTLEELHVINLSSDFTHHFVFFFGILFSLISMNESHSNFFSNNSCRVLWS